ncbi:hypothetical protein [Rhodococcoides yunnanense]|uniref:hypothetical protein n=1 Tax=Rhodococcoides yunnanense TaxID=278209 RepID=UPI000935624B|nr:hypothetical protein [Rhodococcus yunnanensis]
MDAETITTIKIARITQYVIDRMEPKLRASLPDRPPIAVRLDHDLAIVHAGDLDIVGIPIPWLVDGDDWDLPDMGAHRVP